LADVFGGADEVEGFGVLGDYDGGTGGNEGGVVVPVADFEGLGGAVGVEDEGAVFIGVEGEAASFADVIEGIFVVAEL